MSPAGHHPWLCSVPGHMGHPCRSPPQQWPGIHFPFYKVMGSTPRPGTELPNPISSGEKSLGAHKQAPTPPSAWLKFLPGSLSPGQNQCCGLVSASPPRLEGSMDPMFSRFSHAAPPVKSLPGSWSGVTCAPSGDLEVHH